MAWGLSWVNAKVLTDYISAQELIFYRYSLTTLSMVPIILFMKQSFRISIRTFFIAIVSSLFLVSFSIFFFNGTKYGTAGLGGAFVTTLVPILIFILLIIFFKKEFTKIDIFALIIGAIGVITILNIWSYSISEILVRSNILFVCAALAWSIMTINNSKVTDLKPLVFIFYVYLFTSIIGYFITPFENGNIFEFDKLFWLNFLMITLLGTTFATSIYFLAIAKIGTNEASSFLFLVPFNAIFLSYVYLDEPIYPSTIIGTVLSIIAVTIINKVKLPTIFRR
jgi:drug/metabolite transporter (DMT)-like permease